MSIPVVISTIVTVSTKYGMTNNRMKFQEAAFVHIMPFSRLVRISDLALYCFRVFTRCWNYMKLFVRFLCLFASFWLATGCAVTLKPFTSDGCSAFPEGTREQKYLWQSCCVAHDIAYWRGGSYQQRHQADNALQACVAKTGQPEVSRLMLVGVRVGGTPYLPTTFRWGYGWQYLRGYKALSAEELNQVEALTAGARQPLPAVPVE